MVQTELSREQRRWELKALAGPKQATNRAALKGPGQVLPCPLETAKAAGWWINKHPLQPSSLILFLLSLFCSQHTYTHRNWHMHVNNAHKCLHAWLPLAWLPKYILINMQALCSRVSLLVWVPADVYASGRLLCTSNCLFARAYLLLCLLFISMRFTAYLYLSKNMWRHSHTHNSSEKSLTHTQIQTHAAMSCQSLRKQETWSWENQWWNLGSTSPGLTVSENNFNYSTWRTKKPKTEQLAF